MEEVINVSPSGQSVFAHADHCKALLQQVPQTFYFGTTLVGLTCMDVCDEYFAFGSDCGALFIFNRRISRPVTPLRTNYDEVITCLRLFSGESTLMAAGHKSGSVVLIRFPSTSHHSRRKMDQTRLSEYHEGRRINCVEWTSDASKLFSADESGTVVVTHVDFDNHLFQPSFVCNEGSPISCISYALSHLAVRSSRRIAVIDVASASTVVDVSESIDESRCVECGIHLCKQVSNRTLLVSSSKGIIYNFNYQTGELRSSNDLQDEVKRRMSCGCSKDFSEESGTWQNDVEALTRLYACGDSRFIYFYKWHVLLFSIAKQSLVLVDIQCLREIELLKNSLVRDVAVDRASEPIALFLLTEDKRVIRLCSVSAPDHLTVATEPIEEFGARTLISSLQKTTKLLPYAPTGAILNRLKANGEMPTLSSLPSLPIPIISNILRSSGDISSKSSEASVSGDSSCAELSQGGVTPEVVVNNASCEGKEDIAQKQANSDATAEGASPQAMKISSEGAYKKPTQNEDMMMGERIVLDWAVSQPNWLLENVNEMAKRVVDVVGGIGAQVEDGYFAMQTSPISTAPSVASDSLPYEQVGMLEEVTVRRTKKAPGRKKKSASEEDDILRRLDSIPSYSEGFNSIDEETLSDIRKALLGVPQSSLNHKPPNKYDDIAYGATSELSDKNHDRSSNEVDTPSSASGATPQVPSEVADGEELNELAAVVGETSRKGTPEGETSESEGSAYDKLMKRALMNRSTYFAGCQEASEWFSEEINDEGLIINDRGDIWNEIALPYSCVSFSVSSKYIVICHAKKKKKARYLSFPNVSGGQWIPIKQDAEKIETNDDGTLVWRIHKGIAYSPVPEEASCSTPCASSWVVAANEGGGVVECALTRDAAWYTTRSGEVYVQLRLPDMGILSRCESPWRLECITASEVAVWALQSETGRLVVRAGLKHCPIGLDWVEIEPEGPTRLISICLYGQSGWAIDEGRSLWFTNGVDYRSPFGTSGAWLQVCRPWDLSVDPGRLYTSRCIVKVSSLGVFVCISRKIYWASNLSPLSGHRFRRIVPEKLAINDSFEMISAGGVGVKNVDALSLCRNNEVFLFRLRNRNFYSLPAFPSCYGSTLVQLISFGSSVYVLDTSGCIYVRRNLAEVMPFGTEWIALNTGGCGSPIVSFAVTAVSIWVLTSEANILMMSRNGNTEPCIDEKAEWVKVRPPTGGASFDQIRASSSGTYVWLFSKVSGRSWARNAVSDQYPCGKSWTVACEEPGVRELAVGCKVVWSLSSSGQLYRLRGLAAGNPAGNYWKVVPIRLRAMSVDSKEHLWGIDNEGRLVSHAVEIYPPSVDRRLSVDILTPSSLDSVGDFVSY